MQLVSYSDGILQWIWAEIGQNLRHLPSQLLSPLLPFSFFALQRGKLPPGQETLLQHPSNVQSDGDRWKRREWAIRNWIIRTSGLTASDEFLDDVAGDLCEMAAGQPVRIHPGAVIILLLNMYSLCSTNTWGQAACLISSLIHFTEGRQVFTCKLSCEVIFMYFDLYCVLSDSSWLVLRVLTDRRLHF